MNFLVQLDKRAVFDIQEAIDYYENRQTGLGVRFLKEVESTFKSVKKIHFFRQYYDLVGCLPLKKFPFMIHFRVNERSETVFVMAVIHCSQNPAKWPKI